MVSLCGVSGILFDSGDTLIYPTSGEWFPTSAITQVLNESFGAHIARQQVRAALQEPLAYLDQHHHVATVAEEYQQWRTFYGMLLDRLGTECGEVKLQVPREELISRLLSLLHNASSVARYPEVTAVLDELRARGFTLGVLSDSWPSLRHLLAELELDQYFDTIVISAEIGFTKPDPYTYAEASHRLGLPTSQILFVDNAPENVEGAEAASMRAVLLDRDHQFGELGWKNVIDSLEELVR